MQTNDSSTYCDVFQDSQLLLKGVDFLLLLLSTFTTLLQRPHEKVKTPIVYLLGVTQTPLCTLHPALFAHRIMSKTQKYEMKRWEQMATIVPGFSQEPNAVKQIRKGQL